MLRRAPSTANRQPPSAKRRQAWPTHQAGNRFTKLTVASLWFME
jgi:hypothetical protein